MVCIDFECIRRKPCFSCPFTGDSFHAKPIPLSPAQTYSNYEVNYMDCLESLSPCELVIITNVATALLAACRTTEELNVLGNMFSAIGSLLSTIAAQQELLDANPDNGIKDLQKQVKELQKQIKRLEEKACK